MRPATRTGEKMQAGKALAVILLMLPVLALLAYYAAEHNRLKLFIEIAGIFVMFIFYIYKAVKESFYPFIDLRIIWAGSFVLYNLFSPLLLLFSNPLRTYYDVYGERWHFEMSDMETSVLLSLVYFAGFIIASIFTRRMRQRASGFGTETADCKDPGSDQPETIVCRRETEERSSFRISNRCSSNCGNRKAVFYLWLILTAAAMLWYVYPYISMGFDQAMSLPRWMRYKTFDQLRTGMGMDATAADTLFNSGLVLLGVFMSFREVACSSGLKAERVIWILLFAGISFFFLFVDGRRRELLYMYLMCGGYFVFLLISRRQRINYKLLVASVVTVGAFFIVYQNYKSFVQNIWIRGFEESIKLQRAEQKKSEDDVLYQTEFALVYLTNLCTVRFRPVPFNGKTFLESMISPVPVAGNILNEWFGYEDDRKSSIELWIAEKYPDLTKSGGGLGFSPVSEAYLNFGVIGCAIAGLLVGVLINLCYFKLFNSKYIVFYCMLLPQAIGMNRIYFGGVTLELFWMFLYFAVYGTFAEMLAQLGGRKKYS